VSEWQDLPLSEVVELVGGGTPKTTVSAYWNGDIPWLSVVDFNTGRKFVTETEKKITKAGLENSSTKLLNAGDIILSARGTVGAMAVLSKPMTFNQSCYGLRGLANKSDTGFIYYLVKDAVEGLQQISHGGVFDTITRDTFKDITLPIPPIEEQKAIASVLSSLDDKIDLLHRQNTTLERMAETLFRQWFVEEAQEDWDELPLDKLVNITSSKRIFYSEYVASGVPFYRSKEIIELHNSGSTNSELFITEARFNEISEKFGAPQENDILLTSVGTLGVPYKVKKSDRFYFKDGNLTWFKDFFGMPSVIIYCWLKSNIGKEQLDSITIGSTQAALTISGLKQIIFKVPPKEIIKLAEGKLTAIYNKVEGNQKQIQTLEKLRDNLLPKLMSGELRIADE